MSCLFSQLKVLFSVAGSFKGARPIPLSLNHAQNHNHNWKKIMAVGNIYLIAAIAIIGGGLFGFDISSMSAMWVR